MDCLNPGLLQREQGAFYTPVPYVRKMHEMLFDAIAEIPENMDYVIIDRCAGTGNLQEGLPDEILKHCILSTIEYNEYAILNYKYGDKCLVVIPNTDALNFDIIPANCNMMNEVVNDYIREKVEDENCAIILMENPPFSEAGSGGTQNTGKKENLWKKSFVITQMKAEGTYKGAVLNDLSNLFIWSGFKYYLRKPHDSYILYSPTKYWRNQQLVNKKFCGGFLCDRRGFHASQASAVGCIWWKNIDDDTTERLCLPPYDIVGDNIIQIANDVILQKAYHNLSEAYDNRTFPDDEDTSILCEANGLEFDDNGRKKRVRPIWNKNIIAYLKADSFAIDRKHVILTTAGYFKGDGFYLRSDNFIEKLPLFVASVFPYDKWYKTDVYSKSYDGQGIHLQDKNFLKQCLIYTALTPKNKCRSLLGSDGRFYRNELCFHKKDTLAWTYLQKFISDGHTLTGKEEKLLKRWDEVLRHTEETVEYADITKNENARIGLWQIMEEVNIKENTGKIDRKGNPILRYKYIMLNTAIKVLDNSIKEYYNSVITPLLFKYQLIK